jgi:hypothetical protein
MHRKERHPTIDYKGDILFHPQFDDLNFALHPRGLVSRNGKYHCINIKGEIEIRWVMLSPMSDFSCFYPFLT